MKAIFFDFDGTLTYKSPNIWKTIWKSCDYDTSADSYFADLLKRFMKKEITHQEWCDLTYVEFAKAKFNVLDLNLLADNVHLINGLKQTLKVLKENNVDIHIVSGNIVQVIARSLGTLTKYFSSINGNRISFDERGVISHIKGTTYDFEGKAKFINEYKEKTGLQSSELVFVGNGDNDEWAHLSGCKTICINPDETDSSNFVKWHLVKDNVTDITDILPLLSLPKIIKNQNKIIKQ
ncbi:MAG: HAD-IB family phosphatase [Clostridia bacterium]